MAIVHVSLAVDSALTETFAYSALRSNNLQKYGPQVKTFPDAPVYIS